MSAWPPTSRLPTRRLRFGGRVAAVPVPCPRWHGCPRVHRVLGIETSCDETAAAVVDGGSDIVSSVVSSQVDLHARYGGVVPELAGRAHLELLTPVLAEALGLAGLGPVGHRHRRRGRHLRARAHRLAARRA